MPLVNLTDRFCAGAKPLTGKRTDYFDESVVGLALRVSPTGHKAWTLLFTSPRDGKRARHHLGTYPATTLAAARGLAIEARQEVEEDADPRATPRSGTAELTFADLLTRYLADPDKAKLRSVKEIERRLNKDALPVLGSIKLAKLARRDVTDVMQRIAKRDASRQAYLTFKDIQAVLRWAVREEFLERNPIEGMKKSSGSTPKERVLSDDEVRTLWSTLPDTVSRPVELIVKLCLVTGQRVGEVAGMVRSELNLDRKIWTLPGARVKNAHPHDVPLSDMALALIGEALAEGEGAVLFPGVDGTALDSHVIGRAITRGREASKELPLGRFGIAHWSAHDLRRTALTGMANLGVLPHVIAHVANHRSITKSGVTFAHYIRYSYERETRAALELWADRLTAIVRGDSGTATVVAMKSGRAS